MKTLVSQLSYFLQKRTSQRNLKLLVRLFFVFLGIVALFSALFHFLMQREGHEHTWITGFYWTLTVMSTLGFGDITFHTDLGRAFSMMVLLTGILYMLV
ncbi:MAG: potassium channel family protein, partial [Candidatus Latescibacteria bacterium]|nr:potassium channel family protein [Candidatus Latescibacterota bacterium]